MARNRKTTLVVFSDLHVGSSVGLWPGKHAIEGGGVYEANVYQKWLYDCWKEMVAQIGYLVLEYDGVDVVVKPRMFPLPGWHVEEPWRPTQKLWNWEQGSERRESWKSMLRRTLRSRI